MVPRSKAKTLAFFLMLVSCSFLFSQDQLVMSSRRAGVLMRPLASHTGKRAGANGAPPSGGATVTPENLWRFPAEQPNVQSLLSSPDFFGGLSVITPDSNGQYDAYFRDYFIAGEAFISNAQNGDSYDATLIATPPTGGGEPFPPINFYATLNGDTNCFLAQTQFPQPPATPICGSTSLDVFWVGSAQCNDGPGWYFQYTINGNPAASSNPFYVHPRIPVDNASQQPSVLALAQGQNQELGQLEPWALEAYDTDCYTVTNGKRSKPFYCDGRTGQQQFTIAAKGCFLTDSAMLLTYHGYSATPSYSVLPGSTNGLNMYLNGLGLLGYDHDSNVNPEGLNSFAKSQQSSFVEVDRKACIGPACDSAIYADVCSLGPQMLGVNDTGNTYPSCSNPPLGCPRAGQLTLDHWVTVVGQPDDKRSWIIEDPAGGLQDTTTALQGYTPYLAYRAFSGPEFNNPPNAIGISLFSPAELILTDPSGNRVGLDPVTDTSYDEIQGSGYIASFLTDDDAIGIAQGQADAPEVKELRDTHPQAGQYTITVTGTGAGTYSMPVYLTDQNGVTNFTELDNIPTNAGVVHKFTFTYTSPFPSSTPGPVALSGAISSANQFLGFASPFVAATLVPSGVNNFPLLIFYGSTTYPGTFAASLNGQDIHTLFSPAPGTFQGVNIPLPNGESTLTLQINGITSSGQVTTDTETLLFDVGGSAPSAPTGLTAIPVSTSEIDLSWTASASSGVGNPAVTYSVFRSTTRGFTPSASNQVASGLTSTSYADTGLAVFTKFFYVVEAVTPFASSAASNQATARTQPIVSGGTVSSIRSNFNGTAIASGDYIWLSAVFQPKSLPNAPVVFFVRNSMITFTANGTNYRIPTPDADITFDPSETTATTNFNASIDQWQTLMPSGGFAGNTLLDAVEFPVPSPGGLPGGIQNVTWTASFSTDTAGVSLNWQWASAAYSSFSTNYDELGVKPVDDNKVSEYQNSDHAGTPENYKTYVTGGAMGGGGSNYTGSNSGTTSVNPVVVTSSGGGGGTS